MPARRTSENGPGLLPTPVTRKDGGSAFDGGAHARKRMAMMGLMPTPRKTDADRGGRGDLIQVLRGNKTNSAHGEQRMLPTPTATDYGTNQGGAAGRTGTVRPSLRTMLTPTATGSSNIHGTAVLLAIYAWMMGFPPGWLPAAEAPTGTRWSRKSSKPLATPSSRRKG